MSTNEAKQVSCLRLALVPHDTLSKIRTIAETKVRGGAKLESMFKMKCRGPRGYGAPRRRNSCMDHVLLEVHKCVLSEVFPRQRGRVVKLDARRTARRYCARVDAPVDEEDSLASSTDVHDHDEDGLDDDGIVGKICYI
jgi:hypothetical protein